MHSAELNIPQNHVYLFKPQFICSVEGRQIRRDAERIDIGE